MSAWEWLDAVEARANAATGGPWIVYMTMHAEPKVIREKGGYPAGLIADPSSAPADYGIADAEFIAHARTDLPALVAALRAVLDRHQPMRIYDECGHPHAEGDPGVIDTGEFTTCEEEYLYSICRECCVENPDWPEQAEWCAPYHDHGKDDPICATVAAIDAHVPGGGRWR